MEAEIDMSGRVEETNRMTAIALANDISISISISASEKQKLIKAMLKRKLQKRNTVHVSIFSSLLFLLLREHIEKLDLIAIDPEYPSYEAVIKNRLLTLCENNGLEVDKECIYFEQVGKKSPAHDLAIKVYRGKATADREVTAKEILDLLGG